MNTRAVRVAVLVCGVLVMVLSRVLGSSGVASPQAGPVLPPPGGQVQEPGTYRSAPVAQLLSQVKILPERPSAPGYDRECGSGRGCVFGPAWSDDVDVEYGHNGCDQRNDLLRSTLTKVSLRPGTNGCVVQSGTLIDPYTGQRIAFDKARAHEVQLDHVFALSRAWDMGAHAWTPDRRRNFANDPSNLIVTQGAVNASKGDLGPGEWLPISRSFACTYVARYLKVAVTYQLPITQADADSATGCVAEEPR